MIGPVAFLAPWLLLGLAALPVLWWLLRAVPPAPGRKAFPGVRLLLGLKDPEKMPERTPWWLLLLRMTALAAAILAFAGPVLNPRPESSGAPLLVLVDGGWGDAPDWAGRMDRAAGALAEAARDGRPRRGGDDDDAAACPARRCRGGRRRSGPNGSPASSPRPWAPDRAAWAALARRPRRALRDAVASDGIGHGGEEALARALLAHGPVTLAGPPATALALTPPTLRDGALTVEALRADAGAERPVGVVALGPDPNGIERVLGAGDRDLRGRARRASTLALDMPMELRNRVARIQLADGQVGRERRARRRHRAAPQGRADVRAARGRGPGPRRPAPLPAERPPALRRGDRGAAPEMLNAAPDVLVLADVGTLGDAERAVLVPWVEKGGLLVRFAGPRLAQSGAGQLEDDPLLPVRLRAGGRSIGGAMSWGAPRRLKPFPENGPFAGLPVPDDVDISCQVMAQPDPDLPDRVMATLEDGTPLVTGRPLGDGRVVLFHVTASADWSSLPLSGLFVRDARAPDPERRRPRRPPPRRWPARCGRRSRCSPASASSSRRASSPASPASGSPRRGPRPRPRPASTPAASAASRSTSCAPATASRRCRRCPTASSSRPSTGPRRCGSGRGSSRSPSSSSRSTSSRRSSSPAASAAASARGHGRRGGGAPRRGAGAVPARPRAQERAGAGPDAESIYAANETVLAYVETGNARVDAVSAAGLAGLSRALFDRTAIEPADPVAVDIETHDLSLYPFLYWPVTESQQPPSDAAVARLNDFLRFGGMILFDTQDADLGGSMGGDDPERPRAPAHRRAARRAAARADPERPRADPHLLPAPGLPRAVDRRAAVGRGLAGGRDRRGHALPQPQRRGDAVVIGSNDWAAAWATQENGQPMFPVGRGIAGERQREMALRFGINLIMYVMTGNYKSDQVHVPALLDRLGQ